MHIWVWMMAVTHTAGCAVLVAMQVSGNKLGKVVA